MMSCAEFGALCHIVTSRRRSWFGHRAHSVLGIRWFDSMRAPTLHGSCHLAPIVLVSIHVGREGVRTTNALSRSRRVVPLTDGHRQHVARCMWSRSSRRHSWRAGVIVYCSWLGFAEAPWLVSCRVVLGGRVSEDLVLYGRRRRAGGARCR